KEQPGRTTTSHRSNRHPPAQYNSDSPQAPSVKIPHRDWVVQKKLQISQAYSAWGIEQIHPVRPPASLAFPGIFVKLHWYLYPARVRCSAESGKAFPVVDHVPELSSLGDAENGALHLC